MKRWSFLLPFLLLAFLVSPASALSGFEVGVRGMYWFPDLSATAQTIIAGVPETKINLKDDLGMDDENFPSGEAFLRVGRVQLRIGYILREKSLEAFGETGRIGIPAGA